MSSSVTSPVVVTIRPRLLVSVLARLTLCEADPPLKVWVNLEGVSPMFEGFSLTTASTLKVELSPMLDNVRLRVTLSPVRRTWYGDWPRAGIGISIIHVASQLRCHCVYVPYITGKFGEYYI